MTKLQCDFCSTPDPTWRHPARSFQAWSVENVAGASIGDWAACDECHRLIERGDREGLTLRSFAELMAAEPEVARCAGAVVNKLAEIHRGFFAHRAGPAAPIAA